MFATNPQCLFPVPKGLSSPNAEYWRAFHLVGALSFYIATFRVKSKGDVFHETWCIGSDCDLIQRIQQAPDEPLVGLLCLLPPWASEGRQWSARPIGSVWRGVDQATGSSEIVLVASDGNEFVPAISNIRPVDVVHRELVAHLGHGLAAEGRSGLSLDA